MSHLLKEIKSNLGYLIRKQYEHDEQVEHDENAAFSWYIYSIMMCAQDKLAGGCAQEQFQYVHFENI